MAKLLLHTPDGRQEVYPLEAEVITIGRAEDNHLAWPEDSLVSRYHASISRRHGDFWVHDYHSHNGTFVNQMRVRVKRLEEGDEITIGHHTLTFSRHTTGKPESQIDPNRFKSVATWVLLEEDLSQTRDHRFELLRQIIDRLGRIVERKTLRETIKDALYQAFHPERAYLLLSSPDHAELIPEASYDEPPGPNTIERSRFIRAVVDQVLEEKEPLLKHEVQGQGRRDLRSILCTPLWQGSQVIGVVYVDDSRRGRRFRNEELELLVTIATQVAHVVERVCIHEQLQREALLRSHLERFVAPSVVETITWQTQETGELSTTAEEREVTILFSDIKGFTPMVANMRATEVAKLLSRYLTEMTDIIFSFGGTLDKYIGDGIMAIFGAPLIYPNHAERAVQAALAMLERHHHLMTQTPAEEQFAIRIGVNTGPAVVGFIGTAKRLEYTAVGNTVNVASRLESAADPNHVWVGGSTLQRLITAQHQTDVSGDSWQIEEGLEISPDIRVQVESKGKRLMKNIEVEAYCLMQDSDSDKSDRQTTGSLSSG